MDILFISTSYNQTSATSICLWSIVNMSVKRCHRCRIITETGIVFDSLKDKFPQNSSNFKKKSKIKKCLNYLANYITWPYYPFYHNVLFQLVKKEVENDTPDMLVCSVGTVYSLEAGFGIKSEFREKIIYVGCFFDALLSGPSLHFMSEKKHDKLSIKVENRLLSIADSVIMMKAAQKKHILYQNKLTFTKRIKYLDIPLYNPLPIKRNLPRHVFPSNETILFFAGSMPNHVRNPYYFLKLFVQTTIDNLHLYIAGKSDYIKMLKEFAQLDSRIHLLGILPHEQIQDLLSEADFLVNIGNSITGMIPSKIFEYMSADKPIISTYRIDNDPCNDYLTNYGNAILIDEKSSLSQASNHLISFINKSKDFNSLEKKNKEKLYENTPYAYVDFFEELEKKRLSF